MEHLCDHPVQESEDFLHDFQNGPLKEGAVMARAVNQFLEVTSRLEEVKEMCVA